MRKEILNQIRCRGELAHEVQDQAVHQRGLASPKGANGSRYIFYHWTETPTDPPPMTITRLRFFVLGLPRQSSSSKLGGDTPGPNQQSSFLPPIVSKAGHRP
jgi:hypothetical protein